MASASSDQGSSSVGDIQIRIDNGPDKRYCLWTFKQDQVTGMLLDSKKGSGDFMTAAPPIPKDAPLDVVRFGATEFRRVMAELLSIIIVIILI